MPENGSPRARGEARAPHSCGVQRKALVLLWHWLVQHCRKGGRVTTKKKTETSELLTSPH